MNSAGSGLCGSRQSKPTQGKHSHRTSADLSGFIFLRHNAKSPLRRMGFLLDLVANRGIEPRTRGFSRQITRLASIRSTRRIVTNFLTFRPTVETLPNPLPNFCGLSVAAWPLYRTASMGCTEAHRSAADIAILRRPAASVFAHNHPLN